MSLLTYYYQTIRILEPSNINEPCLTYARLTGVMGWLILVLLLFLLIKIIIKFFFNKLHFNGIVLFLISIILAQLLIWIIIDIFGLYPYNNVGPFATIPAFVCF